MAIPIISDLLERLFGPSEDIHSRDDVKRRLQIVLAHDRLALDPQALEMMRQEIIAVVSRYVEVDFDSLEFSLATDQRMTALTANLPIRRIRPLGRGADQPIEPEEEAEEIELAFSDEDLALDVTDTESALRQFEENSLKNPDLVHPPLDIDRSDTTEADIERPEADIEASPTASAEEDVGVDSSEDASLPAEPVPEVPDMSIPDAPAQATSKVQKKVQKKAK